MKQWTRVDFIRMIKRNGYCYNRSSGGHSIYVNKDGRHIAVPSRMEAPIARRLIKENNLNTDL